MNPEQDNQFQGDWNANKGYLQLMINYIALSGESSIQNKIDQEYRVVRQLYKITCGVIDSAISNSAKEELDKIKAKIFPKNIDMTTQVGKSTYTIQMESAEMDLEKVEISILSNVHKLGLILPKKKGQKGIKQLWEEYGLEDGDNAEESSIPV